MRRIQLIAGAITLAVAILALAAGAHGQASSVLNAPRFPSESSSGGWPNAGIPGGIPTRTSICATLTSSATAAAINSAIAACATNGVVLLGAGTYPLTSGINFANHSNVTLRGAGADQTFLNFTGTINCNGQVGVMCVPASFNSWPGGPQHTATCSAGCTPGSTSATLSSTTGIAAGTVVIFDQLNDNADTGQVYVCEFGPQGGSGTTFCAQEDPAGAERSNRAQSQMVTVTGVSGSTVTFTPSLYMPNWRSGQSPGAWWTNADISGVGIENLSFAEPSGANGIIFNNATLSWVKGVRSNDPNRNHVWMQWSSRIVVRDSYFFNTQNHQSQSYGIETYLSSDCLIENNIFQQVTTPFQGNGSSSGCVVGYNFTINNVYNSSPGWMIAGNSLHAAGLDNILFEGNQANAAIFDNIHGTHNFATAFRNRYIGWEATKNTQTNAFQIYAGVRYNNLIGNVLGQAGYHNHYADLAPSGTSPQTSIYVLGWSGNGGATGCCANDTLVASTSMRWGNYDVVNAAVQWNSAEVPSAISPYPNTVPATHTLPNSFYLAGKPSWFGSVPFPPIGPDVTGGTGPGGFSYDIPAKNCYSTIMGGPADGTGSILAFNAATCYAAASGPVATLSASSSACGSSSVGLPASCPTVTLTNTGTATLTISSITTSGAAFSATTTCGGTLGAGSACTITPRFLPVATGAASGSVSIADDSTTGSPQVISLSGSGTPAVPAQSGFTVRGIVNVQGKVSGVHP